MFCIAIRCYRKMCGTEYLEICVMHNSVDVFYVAIFFRIIALVWWLTKMNPKLLWGTGAEIQCPPSLYGKYC